MTLPDETRTELREALDERHQDHSNGNIGIPVAWLTALLDESDQLKAAVNRVRALADEGQWDDEDVSWRKLRAALDGEA